MVFALHLEKLVDKEFLPDFFLKCMKLPDVTPFGKRMKFPRCQLFGKLRKK